MSRVRGVRERYPRGVVSEDQLAATQTAAPPGHDPGRAGRRGSAGRGSSASARATAPATRGHRHHPELAAGASRRPLRRPARVAAPTAPTYAAAALDGRRGRGAHRRRGRRLVPPDASRCWSWTSPARCSAGSPPACTATRPARSADARRDRHPGQDDDHPAGRGRPAGGRRPGRRWSAPSAPGSPGTEVKTALTTPEAPDLHGLFARMREDASAPARWRSPATPW